jgi:hypothetical protein
MVILRWRHYTAALNCRDAADALRLSGPCFRRIGGSMTMRYAGNMKIYGTAAGKRLMRDCLPPVIYKRAECKVTFRPTNAR